MLAARGGVSVQGCACVTMTTVSYHRGDPISNRGRGPAATPPSPAEVGNNPRDFIDSTYNQTANSEVPVGQ